jgi:hypothetical protein
MARYDDLPIQRITVISLIAIAVTIVSILAVQVLYFGMHRYVNEGKAALGKYTESEEFLSRQRRSISQYSVNEDDGQFVIPIEQAMRKIAREASSRNESQPAPPNQT